MIEYDNKISDFRKYLHDKEDTYNSVSLRLKKYEELHEPLIEEKLYAYKEEIEQNSAQDFISELLKEKNYYQEKYEGILKEYGLFTELKGTLFSRCPDAEEIMTDYSPKAEGRVMAMVCDQYRRL